MKHASEKRKPGRPFTGKARTAAATRFDDDVIGKIDAWAKAHEIDRSEAIRRLVELGLTVKAEHRPSSESLLARSGKVAKASNMAGLAIDTLSDLTASTEEQAGRKRRLIKGPTEFRAMRDRAAKKRDRK